MFALSTRVIRKTVGLVNPITKEKTIQTIHYEGKYYADVPEGEDAAALLAILNDQESKAIAYRAQFTDSEWALQMDEAAGG